MTIGKLILCGIIAASVIVFCAFCGIDLKKGRSWYGYKLDEKNKKLMLASAAAAVVIGALLIGVITWWSFNTESGKRAYKDQQSNFSGGITRTVRVFDVEGDLIEEYSGKFDVETTAEYVLFDDENHKRHMIYYTTGTVIIDEQ